MEEEEAKKGHQKSCYLFARLRVTFLVHSDVAGETGIEPATFGFGDRHSTS